MLIYIEMCIQLHTSTSVYLHITYLYPAYIYIDICISKAVKEVLPS